jgi:hypothetical protein
VGFTIGTFGFEYPTGTAVLRRHGIVEPKKDGFMFSFPVDDLTKYPNVEP